MANSKVCGTSACAKATLGVSIPLKNVPSLRAWSQFSPLPARLWSRSSSPRSSPLSASLWSLLSPSSSVQEELFCLALEELFCLALEELFCLSLEELFCLALEPLVELFCMALVELLCVAFAPPPFSTLTLSLTSTSMISSKSRFMGGGCGVKALVAAGRRVCEIRTLLRKAQRARKLALTGTR